MRRKPQALHGLNQMVPQAKTASTEGDKSYTAQLSGDFSVSQGLPEKSSPAQISEDGTLTFSFIKESESFFQPQIEMNIHLMKKDSVHLYIESWEVNAGSSLVDALIGTFDLVKDEKINMMGMQTSNQMYKIAGSKGLCIQKKSV